MNEITMLIETLTTFGWILLCVLAGLSLALLWFDRHRVVKTDTQEAAKPESRHAA